MFGLFGTSTTQKLNKRYNALLQKAMAAQRLGDIRLYSELSEKADLILKEIERLENEVHDK